ncbi:MAG: hypothetical protein EBQ53_01895 [Betaproteobacteria bacterium]|jgi:hypothetical protein|nr:hypothetical protein [Betaproteobacteria bacterium]NBS92221.1 hypothetical protein [Betaproteobacteria bacterium]NBY52440.1 hypothetical protein [Betaproteobacteria bacterium]NCA23355.1 hypothetical protein [Betaproteobacteria bacterium]NCU84758.1 hypothetical protein [Betaproteobacteria bacterium]
MALDPTALDALRQALLRFEAGTLPVDDFCLAWRRALLSLGPQLPPPVLTAADDLLMRMESARWFSGEACGFSGKDLALALRQWLTLVEQAGSSA